MTLSLGEISQGCKQITLPTPLVGSQSFGPWVRMAYISGSHHGLIQFDGVGVGDTVSGHVSFSNTHTGLAQDISICCDTPAIYPGLQFAFRSAGASSFGELWARSVARAGGNNGAWTLYIRNATPSTDIVLDGVTQVTGDESGGVDPFIAALTAYAGNGVTGVIVPYPYLIASGRYVTTGLDASPLYTYLGELVAIPKSSAQAELQLSYNTPATGTHNLISIGNAGSNRPGMRYTGGQIQFSDDGITFTSLAAGVGNGTVTQVNSGNGLTGGPITSSGTLSVLADTGISVSASGVKNTGVVTLVNGTNTTAVNDGSGQWHVDSAAGGGSVTNVSSSSAAISVANPTTTPILTNNAVYSPGSGGTGWVASRLAFGRTSPADGTLTQDANLSWNSATQELFVGNTVGGGAARKALYLGNGGYGAPGTFGVDSTGDKVIFFNGTTDGYDARIGVSGSSTMWFKSALFGGNGGYDFHGLSTTVPLVQFSNVGLISAESGLRAAKSTTLSPASDVRLISVGDDPVNRPTIRWQNAQGTPANPNVGSFQASTDGVFFSDLLRDKYVLLDSTNGFSGALLPTTGAPGEWFRVARVTSAFNKIDYDCDVTVDGSIIHYSGEINLRSGMVDVMQAHTVSKPIPTFASTPEAGGPDYIYKVFADGFHELQQISSVSPATTAADVQAANPNVTSLIKVKASFSTTTAAASPPGSNTLTLVTTAGLSVGDKLFVLQIPLAFNTTITGISGSTVTLASPLPRGVSGPVVSPVIPGEIILAGTVTFNSGVGAEYLDVNDHDGLSFSGPGFSFVPGFIYLARLTGSPVLNGCEPRSTLNLKGVVGALGAVSMGKVGDPVWRPGISVSANPNQANVQWAYIQSSASNADLWMRLTKLDTASAVAASFSISKYSRITGVTLLDPAALVTATDATLLSNVFPLPGSTGFVIYGPLTQPGDYTGRPDQTGALVNISTIAQPISVEQSSPGTRREFGHDANAVVGVLTGDPLTSPHYIKIPNRTPFVPLRVTDLPDVSRENFGGPFRPYGVPAKLRLVIGDPSPAALGDVTVVITGLADDQRITDTITVRTSRLRYGTSSGTATVATSPSPKLTVVTPAVDLTTYSIAAGDPVFLDRLGSSAGDYLVASIPSPTELVVNYLDASTMTFPNTESTASYMSLGIFEQANYFEARTTKKFSYVSSISISGGAVAGRMVWVGGDFIFEGPIFDMPPNFTPGSDGESVSADLYKSTSSGILVRLSALLGTSIHEGKSHIQVRRAGVWKQS